MRKQQHTLGLSVGDVLHKIICFITVQKSAITVICKRLRPDMIFKALCAMKSDYLISCFYCLMQFGWKKNRRKERGRFREHVRERE